MSRAGSILAWLVLMSLAACAPSGAADRAPRPVTTEPGTGGSGGGIPPVGGSGGSVPGPVPVGMPDGGGGVGGPGNLPPLIDAAVGTAPQPDAGSAPAPDLGLPDRPPPMADAAPPPVDLAPPMPDAAPPPPPPNLARGLVGHWKLDEGTGNTVLDSSPVFHHGGTVNILDIDWKPGKRGTALQFTPARRTFIQISHHDTISPREGISLTLWVNAGSWMAPQRLLQKGDEDDEYSLRVEGNRLLFVLRQADGVEVRVSVPPPATGRFVHLAGIYDGRQALLYVDGRLVGMSPAPGGLIQGQENLTLGGRPAGAPDTEFYTGMLDDIVIYDRGLSAVEVRMLFTNGAP